MKTLLQISSEMDVLAAGIEDNNGELTPEMEAWLATLAADSEDKVDAYCAVIKEFELREDAIGREIARLTDIKKSRANAAARLKDRLLWFMQNHGLRQIKTATKTVSVVNNGGAAPIELLVSVDQLPAWCKRIKEEADMAKIRAAIEHDPESASEFALVKERGQHLRIS